ncbi:MAG: hypothetical protein ACK6DN_11330, partial [Planctomycetota bacterium]
SFSFLPNCLVNSATRSFEIVMCLLYHFTTEKLTNSIVSLLRQDRRGYWEVAGLVQRRWLSQRRCLSQRRYLAQSRVNHSTFSNRFLTRVHRFLTRFQGAAT